MGGRAVVIPTDVADPDQVEAAAQSVESQFGPIDVWVNDAMLSVFSPAKEMKAVEYKRVTDVTYLGYVYGTLCAMRRMLPRNRGTIVQVGSALAYRGIPLQSAYCGAKHAIQGFTESVRCELLHDESNVRITMVQLPAVNTTQFKWVKSRLPRKPQPVPPIYQPEVAARAIVWAAHHYRRQWWLGISTVKAIAGNKVAPGYADHYLAEHGYASQQCDGEADPHRPNNLLAPLDEESDYGSHGDFDDRACSFSWQFLLSRHRGALALAGAGLASAIVGTATAEKIRNMFKENGHG